MIEAVLFDMDGTMVSTEAIWGNINRELAQRYGRVFDESMRVHMMGRREPDALTIFRDYYDIDASVEELMEVRKKMVLSRADQAVKNPGLDELLSLIQIRRLERAVATSAFREFAEAVLIGVNVRDQFKVVVTGDDVSNSKPHPEIFLTAAERVGINPRNCLVIEDAQNGVEAGFAAGMKVIAVPHVDSAHHDFSKATRVVNSLRDVNIELLTSL